MRFSYSRVSTYLSCGIRYLKKYVEEIPQLSTPVLITGKAVHAGIEMNYKQKVNSKVDLPVADLKDCVADEIERSFQEELFLTDEEKSVGKQKLRGQCKDLGVKGIEVYHSEVSPIVMPVASEHEFLIPLWDGHQLYGFIDVLDESGIIRDTKTAKKAPVQTIAQTSQQLTAYTMAYRQLFQRMPEKVTLDYVLLSNNPRVAFYESSRGMEDIRIFLKRLKRVIDGIEKEVFLPPTEPWQCLYCQYRQNCEEKLI